MAWGDRHVIARWSRAWNLRRGPRVCLIRHRLWLAWVLLGGCGAWASIGNVSFARTWRIGGWLRLRGVSIERRPLLVACEGARRRRALRLSSWRRWCERMLLWWGLLIRRRGEARTALSLVGHDSAEESSLTMAQCRGRWLRGTAVLWWTGQMCLHRRAAAKLQLVPEHAYLRLVVVLHLQLVLLELVDFVANQFHLLNLLRHRRLGLV